MNRLLKFVSGIILICTLYGCVSPRQPFTKIPPGIWRGILYLDAEIPKVVSKKEITIDDDRTGELPFNFEVVYDESDNFKIVILNAAERIEVNDIKYGRDKATAKDTLIIGFPEYDTYISTLFEEKIMEGYWHVNYRGAYKIKFKAYQGDDKRFRVDNEQAIADFNGRFKLTFSAGTEDAYAAVGVFKQDGKKLTGTFLTETGDYRYLEGLVQGNKAMLSCFDGAHAYLFEMKKNDKNIIGEFRSGIHHREPFEGSFDENAALKSGYDLVKKTTSEPLHFKMKNSEGKIIDTKSDPSYAGKIKIYDVMGTWCPNCKDATNFLMEFQKNNADVAITALAFERYRDSLTALQKIKIYKDKLNLPYNILLAGYYDKKEAGKVIPQIESIKGYPTLIITDKNNVIKKVYTGFYGPATSEHQTFKTEFTNIINELRKS